MARALFPSGPWVGFYKYQNSSQRYLMDLNLRFHHGRIDGDGADGIGTFVITGTYDEPKRECVWQKSYPARHTVAYTGYREGKGIWGTWEVGGGTGGFLIWPLSEGGPPDLSKREQEEEMPEVVAMPISPVRI